MSYLRSITVNNGGVLQKLHYYQCDFCQYEIFEAHPHVKFDEGHACWDCGFIYGKIPEDEFLKYCGIYLTNLHAKVENGQIVFFHQKKKSTKKRNKGVRSWKTPK